MGFARSGIGAQAPTHFKSRQVFHDPIDENLCGSIDQDRWAGGTQRAEFECSAVVLEVLKPLGISVGCQDSHPIHRANPFSQGSCAMAM
ncbi:MAG: hypothetical protein ACXWJC_00850 [Croceibacterium sp.]